MNKNGFGIKWPTMVDMPWKPNQTFKNKITQKLSTYKSYVYLFKCVETNDKL